MLFNSAEFLMFFPIVVLVYYLIPQKVKYLWLLAASYYFYMSWNPVYLLLIMTSTVLTWIGGLLVRRCLDNGNSEKQAKRWMIGCIICNLAILFFFKYYTFTAANVTAIFAKLHIPVQIPAFDVLLPVGISFYTFQALGYLIDVYRGTILPERNILKYALFVSFFPQLVAGPIERSKNLIRQIHEEHVFCGEQVTRGLLLMLWGYFEKLVIADRIAGAVTEIYTNYTNYPGSYIVMATVLFAVQIYCDFAGYTDIAIGAAQVMGFDLMKNFDRPYFAHSVAEFWRRWHISLTSWFRDYVYIPLGGNRGGKLKKYRNILITFLLSGLWHGASWHFVVWGFINGMYQVAGEVTKGCRTRVQKLLRVNTNCFSYQLFQSVVTFALVDFSWLFFRAGGLKEALIMILHSLRNFGAVSLIDTGKVLGLATFTMDEKEFYVLLLAILLLAAVDILKGRMDIRGVILRQNLVFRYAFYYIAIFTILIFGVYGSEFNAAAFIYFQF